MRESHPLFVEGSLSWLLGPVEPTVAQIEAGSPSFSASRSESALSQTLLNQGASLSRISSSVEELHDTMSDLKQSFRSLRLELNTTPSSRSQEYHGDEAMEMLRTVLKELQAKSAEIEKLRLENESLKLKARCMQGRQLSGTPGTIRHFDDHPIPEVQSPGFLNGYGKRELQGAGTQFQIADSFDDDDVETLEHTTNDRTDHLAIAPVKIPLKPAADVVPSLRRLAQYEQDLSPGSVSRKRRDSGEPATKRLRLTLTEGPESPSTAVAVDISQPPKDKKRGRPNGARKSQQGVATVEPQTPSITDTSSNTNTTAATAATAADEAQTEERANNTVETVANSGNTRTRGRPRRALSKASVTRSTSKAASRAPSPIVTRQANKTQETPKSQENPAVANGIPSKGFEVAVNLAELTPESVVHESDIIVQRADQDTGPSGKEPRDDNKQRQAKVAARDLLAKAAMEREEAMADS